MGIQAYLREIGRGTRGARSLTRTQAADLWAQLLAGQVDALQTGAFCMAMRFKGESAEELAGFLDASEASLSPWPAATAPVVVLPSYNGARKLPNLTPLLAALLSQQGLAVLVHGSASDDARVTTEAIWQELDWPILTAPAALHAGQLCWMATQHLSPGLERLLQLRRAMGLRNPAHSVVKLLNPFAQKDQQSQQGTASVVVGSYTHPEYADSMAATVALRGDCALLLRGTEGEPVADLRRQPAMQAWLGGAAVYATASQPRDLNEPLALPEHVDAAATADGIRRLLLQPSSVAPSIRLQVKVLTALAQACADGSPQALATLAQLATFCPD